MEPQSTTRKDEVETLKKILGQLEKMNETLSKMRTETNHEQRRMAVRLEEALAEMKR